MKPKQPTRRSRSGPRQWYSTPIIDVLANLPKPVKIVEIIGTLSTSGYLTLRAGDGTLYKIRMHEGRWRSDMSAEHHADLSDYVEGQGQRAFWAI